MHESLFRRWWATIACVAALGAGACASKGPPAPRVVDISAPDRVVLKGTLFAAAHPGPGVLMLHQCDEQRKVWDSLGTRLAAAGITALSVDYRGYGESGGTPYSKLSNAELAKQETTVWPDDIDAAFAFLARQPRVQIARTGAAGGSCGVSNAVHVAERHDNVKALALLAGPTDRGGRLFLEGANAPPVFAAASADDQYANFVQIMAWTYGVSKRRESRFAQYPTGGHAAIMFKTHSGLADTIVTWFAAVLSGAPSTVPGTNGVPLAPAILQGLHDVDQPGGAAAAIAHVAKSPADTANGARLPEYFVNQLGYEHMLMKDYPAAIDLMRRSKCSRIRLANKALESRTVSFRTGISSNLSPSSPMRTVVFVVGLVAVLPIDAQQSPRWLATWAPSYFAAPAPPRDSVDRTPTYADRTVRQIVHSTLGGGRVRIRLTNEYGERPLVIGSAHIALRDSGATIRATSDRALTFSGQSAVTLGPGAVAFSDPVTLDVPALGDLAISVWVRDTIRATTRHAAAHQTSYVSARGDFTSVTRLAADTSITMWVWLAGVDVVNPAATGVIVALGNSITDGTGTTLDANARWPDVLARRLLDSHEPPKAVVDAGIGGNRVLSPNTGPSALARFDRDVLMQPGVTHVIVLEAINDLTRGTATADPRDSVTAADIIFGYRQLIARAHEHGLLIYGATLTPIGGMNRPTTAGADVKRRAVNEWIRTSGAFDGVIDFEAATRDPAQPDRFLPAFDSGDHLHPSDAGYRAMGDAIDLTLFRNSPPPRRTMR